MNKIVLAFDSFKGSANSYDIACWAEQSIERELPECKIVKFPIADGGEGTMYALSENLDAIQISCSCHDALMRPIEASYAVAREGSLAVLEMSSAAGLTLIEHQLRNPMDTTSYGVGEIILDALNRGCRKFIMGIGGSATNDAGIGMLSALGVRFFDENNNIIEPVGRNLMNIYRIDVSRLNPALKDSSFIIACDVNNPLYGDNGAAWVYAPQKGASKEEVITLDEGLRHYARIIKESTGMDIRHIPGSGAAGGMGGGILPFLNATLKSGIDVVLETLQFEQIIRDADLIFTGEGRIDAQTTMGKALGGILRISQKQNIPVIALAGAVESTRRLDDMGFAAVFSIQPYPVSLEESMNPDFVYENVQRVVSQVIRLIKRFNLTL